MVSDACLEQLPTEMLLNIFSFISPFELKGNVSLVCSRFNDLLCNEQWWLTRIQKEAGVKLSRWELDGDEFNAAHSFAVMDAEKERWKQWPAQERRVAEGHIATVDALRLFRHQDRRFCLSGARDRSIRLWDVDRIQDEDRASWTSCVKDMAHQGWIWFIDEPQDDTFLSCSWDDHVKQWQLTPAGLVEVSQARAAGAVSCAMMMSDGQAVCSTFTKQIHLLDVNNGLQVVDTYIHHRRAVLSLAIAGNYIYSSADDKRLCMVDRRNTSRPVATRSAPQNPIVDISLSRNQLVCGTSKGSVVVLRPDTLQTVYSYKSGLESVRQVQHSRGSVCLMSRGREFRVLSPGLTPSLRIGSGQMHGELARFDYFNEDLAIGDGLGSISFWTKPNQF